MFFEKRLPEYISAYLAKTKARGKGRGFFTDDEVELLELVTEWLAYRMAHSIRPTMELKIILEAIADEAAEIYESRDKNFLSEN